MSRELSAKYESDFAYPTVKDRMPVILTRAIDTVCRMKNEIEPLYHEDGIEDLKKIAGILSKLRYSMQTNKPMERLIDDRSDVALWNAKYEEESSCDDVPRWFSSAWLYVECYMYRCIQQAFQLSSCLSWVDVFRSQKETAWLGSHQAVLVLAEYFTQQIEAQHDKQEAIRTYFKLSLWGNKCDLSISAGDDNYQTADPIQQITPLEEFILCDNLDGIARLFSPNIMLEDVKGRVDIVLDNAGFELFTDLILADYLLTHCHLQTVHFHGKAIPWFVSDVTQHDFQWVLNQMSISENSVLSKLSARWQCFIADGRWVLHFDDDFWTLPHAFSHMQTLAPSLYSELSLSTLVIFKGDLNYRKLVGDRNWLGNEPFSSVLNGFSPAPLCTLRTLKCDTVVGLETEVLQRLRQKHGDKNDWMCQCLGDYAVIQFHSA